jgi:type II secretory pathway predicted ATPase ExeA
MARTMDMRGSSTPRSTISDAGDAVKKTELGRVTATHEPFPEFLDDIYFLSPVLQQNLQVIRHLLQNSRQLILITGPGGSGVSALCRYLATRADRPWSVRLIAAAPSSDPDAILAGVLNEHPSDGQFDDRLVRNLKQMEEQGLQPLIIVDNVELLLVPQLQVLLRLAQMRYRESYYRIILAGHGDIEQRVACVGAPGALQGVNHLVQIKPLAPAEVSAYIAYRLAACGLPGDLIDRQLGDDIAVVSGGLPARINKLTRQAVRPPQTLTSMVDRGITLPGLHSRFVLAGFVTIMVIALLLIISLRKDKTEVDQTVRIAPVHIQPRPLASIPPPARAPTEAPLAQTVQPQAPETATFAAVAEAPRTPVTQTQALPGFPAVLGEESLAPLPGDSYVIQLIGAHELHTIRRFLEFEPALTGNLSLVKARRDNRAWYLLLTGSFANREAAMAGIAKLPEYARKNSPWPRSVAAVLAESDAISEVNE